MSVSVPDVSLANLETHRVKMKEIKTGFCTAWIGAGGGHGQKE